MMYKKNILFNLVLVACFATAAHANFMIGYGSAPIQGTTQIRDNSAVYVGGSTEVTFGTNLSFIEGLSNGNYAVAFGNEIQIHDASGNYVPGSYLNYGAPVEQVAATTGGGYAVGFGNGQVQMQDAAGAYVPGTYITHGSPVQAMTGLTAGGYAIGVNGQTQVHDASGAYVPASLTNFGTAIDDLTWLAGGGFVVASNSQVQHHGNDGAYVAGTYVHYGSSIIALTGLTGGDYAIAYEQGSVDAWEVRSGATAGGIAGTYVAVPEISALAGLDNGDFVVAYSAVVGSWEVSQVRTDTGGYIAEANWNGPAFPIHDIGGSATIPEPATMALLAVGGLFLRRKK